MKYFEKIAILEGKSRQEVRNTFRNAERVLVKNQKEKIKQHSIIGAGLGAVAGELGIRMAKISPKGIGLVAGAGMGLASGAISGVIAGSRGSKAYDIRQQYFGTKDLDKIKKSYKENFKNLRDFYKKEK